MAFKICSSCKRKWGSRDEFLGDPEVAAIGYQVNFDLLKDGFFLFNHARPTCRTTVSVPAGAFFDLSEVPVFERRTTSARGCPEYCLKKEELRSCPAHCECSFVRDILQAIVKWPKNHPPGG